ncbi:MAG: M23 family metallopeptidase [Deltaproteobacteria bacterium]|nr:M23 family metallopeptidase [Deltaproteobacteria bacterium]
MILRDSRQTLLADTVLVAKPVVEPKEEPRPAPAPEPQLIDAKLETLSLCESTESNPDGGRCLWVEPKAPQPGDMVMFETDASSWIGAATLSAFGRDVRMFRVGDRWRGFVAVPFNTEPSAFQTRLTLTSNGDPDSRSYRCLDALVSERAFGVGGQLKVARKFTKRAAAVAAQHGRTSEGNASWVDALEVPTFSPQLFVWPRPGEVTSRFGLSRSYNKKFSTRHMGVDIEGTVGDRVFATQAGVVRYSGKERSTGHTVVIDHGGGILSIYMHLSQRLKHVGDKVMQGELVAYVGRTGRVTGPHLHFAMTVHGRFVDPEQVLSHPLYATAPGLPCRVEPSSHSVR